MFVLPCLSAEGIEVAPRPRAAFMRSGTAESPGIRTTRLDLPFDRLIELYDACPPRPAIPERGRPPPADPSGWTMRHASRCCCSAPRSSWSWRAIDPRASCCRPCRRRRSAEPHITRVFIPAIKAACIEQAGPARRRHRLPVHRRRRPAHPRSGRRQRHRPSAREADGAQRLPRAVPDRADPAAAARPVQPQPALRLLLGRAQGVPGVPRGLGDLPPIPSRADFVVRLYVWDPYRLSHPAARSTNCSQLSAECPERPPYLGSEARPDRSPRTADHRTRCLARARRTARVCLAAACPSVPEYLAG